MTLPEQERVIHFLRDPKSYHYDVNPVEVRETHISWVFLAGPFAYKVKKALSLGFVDYSTPELRRFYCEEEIRLNRRLAPDIYLDVVSVCDHGGNLAFEFDGGSPADELEPVVRMKRLPEGSTLDRLLQTTVIRREHIDEIVSLLSRFYATAPVHKGETEFGLPSTIRETLEGNFKATAGAVGELIPASRFEAIRSAQLSFLTLQAPLFEKRLHDGWIRDGHGDLRAEHVAYLPQCVIIDCVEFNDSFRVADVASDLAFLRMDLEFHGAPKLAQRILETYTRKTHSEIPQQLLDFYSSYRAFVRGKVDTIKLSQKGLSPQDEVALQRRARRYFELAHFYALLVQRPLLVSVGGLAGTGKSTVAAALASELGAPRVRSDEVRKELASTAPERPSGTGFEGGIYSPAHTRKTFDTLYERARGFLGEGVSVVLDATFSTRAERERLRQVGHSAGVTTIHIECAAPQEVRLERMRRRTACGEDASDAHTGIEAELRARYEECAVGESVILDTNRPPEVVRTDALELLRKHCGGRHTIATSTSPPDRASAVKEAGR